MYVWGAAETQQHVTQSHNDMKSKTTRDHVSSNSRGNSTQLRAGGDTAGGPEEERSSRRTGGVEGELKGFEEQEDHRRSWRSKEEGQAGGERIELVELEEERSRR